MKLEDIFDQGHSVARCQKPVRHVVFRERTSDRPAGYYFLAEESVQAVAHRRTVEHVDLMGRLDRYDIDAYHWATDVETCWCESCLSSRQESLTWGGD